MFHDNFINGKQCFSQALLPITTQNAVTNCMDVPRTVPSIEISRCLFANPAQMNQADASFFIQRVLNYIQNALRSLPVFNSNPKKQHKRTLSTLKLTDDQRCICKSNCSSVDCFCTFLRNFIGMENCLPQNFYSNDL